MAESKKPADQTNWADMDHEEEEDQEIGVQQEGGAAAEEKKEGGAEGATQAAEEGKEGKPYPPRKRKDYGDKYNPNYKKGPWRKGQQQFGEGIDRKNFAPPQPRQKTDRGDYVVTSFQIPDRAAAQKVDPKAGAEGETKQKKRRVGAFQLDDSDLEEEEVAVTEEVQEEPVAATEAVKEEVKEPVKEASKTLSKKE